MQNILLVNQTQNNQLSLCMYQHMHASINTTGFSTILCPHQVLYIYRSKFPIQLELLKNKNNIFA